jgi:hypothetical protein
LRKNCSIAPPLSAEIKPRQQWPSSKPATLGHAGNLT